MSEIIVKEVFQPGVACTINAKGDIFMSAEAKEFFGVPCVVVKRTKAGLVQVAIADDKRKTWSFPPRNIDVVS